MSQQSPPRAPFCRVPLPVSEICEWDCTAQAGRCRWVLSVLALTWHFQEQQRNCPVLPSIPVGFSPLLALRHLGILQAHPGSWQPQELCSLSGWWQAGRAAGHRGCPTAWQENERFGAQFLPPPCSTQAEFAAPQLQLQLPSCAGASREDPGACVTAGHRGTEPSVLQQPSRSPVQGPACPARTRTGFPELQHSSESSPSTPRAPPGAAGGDLPCSEPPRVCRNQAERVKGLPEVTRVTIQLSPCPGQPGQLLRQGASLLRAQAV